MNETPNTSVETFEVDQHVSISMPYFEGTTGIVVETPAMREDGKVLVRMTEATQWHDDETGGELYYFETRYVTATKDKD